MSTRRLSASAFNHFCSLMSNTCYSGAVCCCSAGFLVLDTCLVTGGNREASRGVGDLSAVASLLQSCLFLTSAGLYLTGREEYLGFLVMCLALSWINLLYFSRGDKHMGVYSIMIQKVLPATLQRRSASRSTAPHGSRVLFADDSQRHPALSLRVRRLLVWIFSRYGMLVNLFFF